jgi:hypothetical protein
VDETATKRGQQYVSLFVDLDGPRLLFSTRGWLPTSSGAFRLDLMEHGGVPEQIRDLCMDMSAAFQLGAAVHFPLADVTFDRFHVMKLFNDALQEVRRATFLANARTRRRADELPERGPSLESFAVGLDAALVGYLVASFFVTVYYPFFRMDLSFTAVAYLIALRRSTEVGRRRAALRTALQAYPSRMRDAPAVVGLPRAKVT